jgi:hypothetical protein
MHDHNKLSWFIGRIYISVIWMHCENTQKNDTLEGYIVRSTINQIDAPGEYSEI